MISTQEERQENHGKQAECQACSCGQEQTLGVSYSELIIQKHLASGTWLGLLGSNSAQESKLNSKANSFVHVPLKIGDPGLNTSTM